MVTTATVPPTERPSEPPKPLDPPTYSHQEAKQPSFRDVLMTTTDNLSQVYESAQGQSMNLDPDKTMAEEGDTIYHSKEELRRLYLPWRNSIIIKVFEKKNSHIYLKHKLQDLWQPTEQIVLIDLGNDYHIVKFQSEDNKNKVLHEGHWFMDENFISVRKWEPNFVPKKRP